MNGVDPELVVGAGTEVIAGEHLIVTAGGIDSHIHFIAPQQVYEAISSRHHDHDWRRNWPRNRYECHDLYTGGMEPRTDVASGGRLAY